MTIGLRGTDELAFQSFNTGDAIWPTRESMPGSDQLPDLAFIAKVELQLVGEFDEVFSM